MYRPGDRLQHEHRVGGTGHFAEPGGEAEGIGEIAVVPQCQPGGSHLAEGRLGVFPHRRPRGGVASVTDPDVAGQSGQGPLVEDLCDQSHVLEHGHGLTIRHGDAGALLPAVLQGEEPEVGEMGRVLTRRVHTEYAASFAGFADGPSLLHAARL